MAAKEDHLKRKEDSQLHHKGLSSFLRDYASCPNGQKGHQEKQWDLSEWRCTTEYRDNRPRAAGAGWRDA
eukprot:5383939-Pyramimonas_sp.AAC.1